MRILLEESDVSEHAVHSAKTADCDAMSAILRHVPMSRFVEVGEFHVGGTWVDTLGSAVSLPMSSQIEGAACLMIGAYIGPEIYAIESLLRSKGKTPTKALVDVLQKHALADAEWCRLNDFERMASDSLLASISVEDVQAEVSVPLTTEQRKVCGALSRRPFVDAVAGSGKSTVACGVLCACLKKRHATQADSARKQKLVFLTNTRTQRDKALVEIRAQMTDPHSRFCSWEADGVCSGRGR